MKIAKYVFLAMGFLGLVASIYMIILEGSILSNISGLIGSAFLIWVGFRIKDLVNTTPVK